MTPKKVYITVNPRQKNITRKILSFGMLVCCKSIPKNPNTTGSVHGRIAVIIPVRNTVPNVNKIVTSILLFSNLSNCL